LGATYLASGNKKLSNLMAHRQFEIFQGYTASSLDVDRPITTLLHADAFTRSDEGKISKRLKYRAVFTATTVYVTDIDEYFTGKKVVTVQFLLPTGSYATMLVKQLMETLTENKV
jgi:tRNA(Glu) U13 pseudouridine synthase TruD